MAVSGQDNALMMINSVQLWQKACFLPAQLLRMELISLIGPDLNCRYHDRCFNTCERPDHGTNS